MKSLSEIETVSKRASRAAGFSWGICEEIGKNIRLLEMFGFPGIKNLNQYLEKKKEQKFEHLKLINAENKASTLQYCPIISGTSLLDQINSIDNLNEINFEKIAFPVLFLPFASRASEIVGKRIFLKFDECEFLLNFNNNIFSNFSDHNLTLANFVTIKLLKNSDSFSDKEWNKLYKLSEKTFVEENDSSKESDAGAGLTDND